MAPELTRDLGEPFERAWRSSSMPRSDARRRASSRACSVSGRARRATAWPGRIAVGARRAASHCCSRCYAAGAGAQRCRRCDVPGRLKAFEVLAACAADYDASARRWPMSRAASPPTSSSRRPATLKMPGARASLRGAGTPSARRALGITRSTCTRCSPSEQTSRNDSAVAQRLREARFPEVKTLDSLISPSPRVSRLRTLASLARGEWVSTR